MLIVYDGDIMMTQTFACRDENVFGRVKRAVFVGM